MKKQVYIFSLFFLIFGCVAGTILGESIHHMRVRNPRSRMRTEASATDLPLIIINNSRLRPFIHLNPNLYSGSYPSHFMLTGNVIQVNTVVTYQQGNTTYIIPHTFNMQAPPPVTAIPRPAMGQMGRPNGFFGVRIPIR
ncbi:MAG: hypothetical protein ACYCOO_05365 [Chitinophagaceae bacterium]